MTTNTLRIGLYGTNGHQIHGTARDLARATITATAGFGAVKREAFPALAQAQEVADLDALLAREDVDLVSLTSPRRADQARDAIRCLDAGKHVLAEKPLATSLEDLRALRRAAERSRRKVFAMLPQVYEPGVRGMAKLVADGVLGTLVQAHAQKSYPYRDTRPQDRGTDGGIIQAAIHAISFIRSTTGQEIVEVFAFDTQAGNPKPGELQMAMTLSGRLSGGAVVSIVANYANQKSLGTWGNEHLRLHGTAGFAELVDGLTRRALYLPDEKRSFDDVPPVTRYPQDIVNHLLDGTPVLLTQEDSFRCTAIALAAQQSADEGRPVAVELDV